MISAASTTSSVHNVFWMVGAYLTTPMSILEKTIGMFHVHGHQDSCFSQYATAFIEGAGMVNGEILETLWSTLNSISPSLCTATLVHWSEVLDDHMNDGNWKKNGFHE